MLANDKYINSKYHYICVRYIFMLFRIIQDSISVFLVSYTTLVEAVRCLVVRSTRRFHVLHGRSKAGVMLSTAELRWTLSAGAHSTLQWLK